METTIVYWNFELTEGLGVWGFKSLGFRSLGVKGLEVSGLKG